MYLRKVHDCRQKPATATCPPRERMEGIFLTGLLRRRDRCFALLALILAGFAANEATAQGSTVTQMRRNWWFQALGGNYGLVEVSQVDHGTQPAQRRSRTSILMGPWRWTFDATAPQMIAVVAIPTVVGLFTYGWIRIRRRTG